MRRGVGCYLPACSGNFGQFEAYQIVLCVTVVRSKQRHMHSALLQHEYLFGLATPYPTRIERTLILFKSLLSSPVTRRDPTMSSMSSFRGGYAPRRGRGGWNNFSSKPRKQGAKPDTVKNPLGGLIETLSVADLKLRTTDSITQGTISDLKYIASYNWRKDTSPTILVPGRPPPNTS